MQNSIANRMAIKIRYELHATLTRLLPESSLYGLHFEVTIFSHELDMLLWRNIWLRHISFAHGSLLISANCQVAIYISARRQTGTIINSRGKNMNVRDGWNYHLGQVHVVPVLMSYYICTVSSKYSVKFLQKISICKLLQKTHTE